MARRNRQAGLTMVEAAITVVLLGLILGSISLVTDSSARAFRMGAAVEVADAAGKHALDSIGACLAAASANNVFPVPRAPFSTPQVDLQRGIGFQRQALVWGPPERIVLSYASGESDDGLDNNANGLVDECQALWIENPGLANQRLVTLCSRVSELLEGEQLNGLDDNGNGLIDERGLCFDFSAENVTVRLTVEHVDARGALVTRTFERTVSFRNKGS